jgi:large subunit ribosomal protein L18e|tara:strand:+ start:1737 stop:2111 length:375 start_codon:yes stop_codon:yes gene_type:complete
MKSKTKIDKQIRKKTSHELVETIINLKKHDKWLDVARILSGSRKNMVNFNLEKINNKTNEGEIVIIPGKVLSQGEVNKKIKIIAFGFSEKAKEKLSKSKIEFSSINEEIKINPTAKGITILKNG